MGTVRPLRATAYLKLPLVHDSEFYCFREIAVIYMRPLISDHFSWHLGGGV